MQVPEASHAGGLQAGDSKFAGSWQGYRYESEQADMASAARAHPTVVNSRVMVYLPSGFVVARLSPFISLRSCAAIESNSFFKLSRRVCTSRLTDSEFTTALLAVD